MFHHWIALGVFALLSFIGLLLTSVGIGGTFLVFAGAILYNVIVWSMKISLTTLLIIAGLAVLGEILEFIISTAGLKAKGVSRIGTLGSFIGSIIGGIIASPIFPIIGTVIGVFLGAMIGAFVGEYLHTRQDHAAWQAAKAAFFCRILVSLSKMLLAGIQVWLVLRDVSLTALRGN